MKQEKEEYIHYRLSRAFESLQEADMLGDSGHWNTCADEVTPWISEATTFTRTVKNLIEKQ